MSKSPLVPPSALEHDFRRVAVLFAGGPAPAANAVISTAAASFLRQQIPVYGILHGYSALVEHSRHRPVAVGRDYLVLDSKVLKRTRNSRGILLGTARTNPGKMVSSPAHLDDPERTKPLRTVYEALRYLEVDALISIGGNDTLTSANKMKMFQDRLPPGEPRISVVHLPKTIDNDYSGIDFTFGFFTAVEMLAEEIRNLLADAEANNAYFLTETMGRSAGWLSYGAAIAGEASLVISVEDIQGEFRNEESFTDAEGNTQTRPIMNVDRVIKRIVKMMLVREERERKQFGVIVIAEGLAEYLPQEYLEGIPRDDFGHIAISQVDLGKRFAKWIAEEYEHQTGRKRKVNGLQLGYESRCAVPHAFDVMLGSQLGVGAYRALVEEKLDGVMVSVSGQLDLHYVPFEQLVDPETLDTKVRFIEPNSDFHRLARFLETNINQ
ncbi:MAG: 6-phosphofructokinase [Planctomycetota bacterium]|nr:MAG: 6-phosphofructokinase [Planctomycetota bacterium]REJ95790.1 MAG: 6-phosphofructokinase [Planctomycetota bacterium]